MRFVDSHCHLAMHEEADAALERAREAGVTGFLVPATTLDDAPAAVAVAERNEDVWAAVGFHPHEAKDFDDRAESIIDGLLAKKRVIAVGEIGLDYHYDHSPREMQKKVMVRHLDLARSNDLPVIIHNRESTDDLLEILSGEDGRDIRGVLHSFTETWEVAERLIDLGFYISFSGIVTFRSADALREAARRVPRERTLIETDTPYLAPVPHRGKKNEPAWVVKVAEQLADLWGVGLDEVAEVTTRNFETLFGVRV
jgi:TatD DNase family protein